ncbi:MAG: lipid-A-disaccharide synthase N-terminal domain-containing protein [Bacteroidales bacterium]|nr:lipid-A-disaccharide synthase N-terminal domain-containing protein [Bacteroidales bacterium]MBR5670491.1 lipid-A-disaccharide synthase N-terminal domain-containing protein [Bacteroidales bacterium]
MNSSWYIYALGFVAQGLFSARILVQWLMSEKQKKVVNPTIFWVLSLVASIVYFVYAYLRSDFSIMLGLFISYFIYLWNMGMKGVWKKLPDAARISIVSALVALPFVAVSVLFLRDPSAAVDTLFKNELIPGWMIVMGTVGQLVFTVRFIYQFIYSHKRNESLLPVGFWIIGIIGATILVTYGALRHDWVLLIGQAFGWVTYVRNLMIWNKSHRAS